MNHIHITGEITYRYDIDRGEYQTYEDIIRAATCRECGQVIA